MRVTIELDTNDITDRDRRVLAALVSDDGTPLVLPIPGAVEHEPAPAGPPSPVPAPPEFMQRLGQAAAQFGRAPGAAHEARLPVTQQAGVRTRSTMPDDDDVVDAGAELEADLVERMARAELGRPAQRGDADALVPDDGRIAGVDVTRDTTTVVTGAVRDGVVHIDEPVLHIVAPPPPAHADRDPVQRMTETARIPRASVELDPVPYGTAFGQERVRQAILGVVDAPVRHTSP